MDKHVENLLGRLLIKEGILTEEQLKSALSEQAKSGEPLSSTLLRLQLIHKIEPVYQLLARQLGVPFVQLKDQEIVPEIIGRIPAQLACYYQVVPVSAQNGHLTVAMSNPRDIHQLDGLSASLNCRIKPVLAEGKDILDAIRRYYGVGAETIEQMMDTVAPHSETIQAVENILEIDSEASIGRFINQLLLEAYRDRATDIHIEPYEDELQIRYRIDGLLYDAKVPVNIKHFKDSINSRIKILSNLNIAEKRLPQDGRFKVKVGDARLDLRVSFLPTAYGESVVIRILNQNQLFDLRELGLLEGDLQTLDRLLQNPHGVIFVTGPTGSGKTTTLYSCLSRVKQAETKILTIEDPVEYQLRGITQIQINPAIGLTFAQGLRSMLRHDPDIMMVGEVRDRETADIAIQVALTGHRVFSTLHTNDAASGITRLLDMGVEPFLISSSVMCFIAQRLVRVICPHCKYPVKASSSSVSSGELEDAAVFAGKGCEACQMTGYHGRKGIYEFLVLDDDLRDMIHRRASATQIHARAVEKGMRTLRQDGWEKVKKGLTTPEEVIRVTQESLQ